MRFGQYPAGRHAFARLSGSKLLSLSAISESESMLAAVPLPPERPFDATWFGHPLLDGDGADRHSEIVVDALWSHGITSREAAERQGVSHQRLAAYLRTSEPTITRAVNAGVAKGLLDQLDLPRTSTGGAGKFVRLTPKGAAAAPVIVQYNLVSAGTHLFLSAVSET